MRDDTAVIGRRILAYIIDAIIVGIVVLALFMSMAESVDGVPSDFCEDVMDNTSRICLQSDDAAFLLEGGEVAALVAVSAGGALLYLGIIQGLTGTSLGKLMAGVRVVRADGSAPGVGRGVVRWLMLIVDTFPWFLPIVGFVTSLASAGHRRVGDMVAGTYVVNKDAAGRPIAAPGLTRPQDPPWPGAAPGAPGPWAPPPPPPGYLPSTTRPSCPAAGGPTRRGTPRC